MPDLGAPGVDILSTATSFPGAMLGAGSPTCVQERQFADPAASCRLSGTSMAAPQAAGAAAIVRQQHPDLDAAAVASLLIASAVPTGAEGAAQGPVAEGAGMLSLPGATASLDLLPVAGQPTLHDPRASTTDIDDTIALSNPTGAAVDASLLTRCAPYWPTGGVRGYDHSTAQVPCSLLSVPASISVPAHGTASVTVHELGDPSLGVAGSWYGSLDVTVGSLTHHLPFRMALAPLAVFHVRNAAGSELASDCGSDFGRCLLATDERVRRAWLTNANHDVYGVTLGAPTALPGGPLRFAFLDSGPARGRGADGIAIVHSLAASAARGTVHYWFGGSDLKRTVVRNAASDGTPGAIENVTLAADRFAMGDHWSLSVRDDQVLAPVQDSSSAVFWTQADTPATLGLTGFASPAAETHFLADNPNAVSGLRLNANTASELWAASYDLQTFGDAGSVGPRAGATTTDLQLPQPSADDPVDRSGYFVRVAGAESLVSEPFWHLLLPSPPRVAISLKGPYFDFQGETSDDVENLYENAHGGGGSTWFWSGYRRSDADAYVADMPGDPTYWSSLLETPWPPPPVTIPAQVLPRIGTLLPSARLLVGSTGNRVLAGPFTSDANGFSSNGRGSTGSADWLVCHVEGVGPQYDVLNSAGSGLPLAAATDTADCTIDGDEITWTGLEGATEIPTVTAAGPPDDPLATLHTTASAITVEQQVGGNWSVIPSTLSQGVVNLSGLDPAHRTRFAATLGTVTVTSIVEAQALVQPVELQAHATGLLVDPGHVRLDLTAIVTPSDTRPLAGGGFAPVRLSCGGTTLGYLYGNGFEPPGSTLDARWVDPGSSLATPAAPAGSQVSARRLSLRVSDCPLAASDVLSLDLAVDQPYLSASPAHLVVDVTPQPLSSITPPGIHGETLIGRVLDGDDGNWSGDPSIERAWYRCEADRTACVDLGSSGSQHTVVPQDIGHTLRFAVTATAGSRTMVLDAFSPVIAVLPLLLASPAISGLPIQGTMLQGSAGSWSGTPTPALATHWLRCDAVGEACAEVSSTRDSYLLTELDLGHTIVLSVDAANGAGTVTSSARSGVVIAPPPARVPVVAASPPLLTSSPRITGAPLAGKTLHADDGSWSGAPAPIISRVWQRCRAAGGSCGVVLGHGAAYTIAAADAGHMLRLVVTASNASAQVNATATVSVAAALAAGAPDVVTRPRIAPGLRTAGHVVAITTGKWMGAPGPHEAYRWYRGGHLLKGPRSARYRITKADQGHHLRCRVTATNATGSTFVDVAFTVARPT